MNQQHRSSEASEGEWILQSKGINCKRNIGRKIFAAI